MHNLIKKGSQEPLYQQIKDVVSNKISQGEWSPGKKIPSENELVESLNVSRMTINRALNELTRDGILNRVHGLGTFICEPPRHASLIQLRDIAEEIRARGRTHSSKVLSCFKIKAVAVIADQMQIKEFEEIFYLKTIHYQDDLPIQLEQRYVNIQLVPNFLTIDFTRQTASRYLMELIIPDEMEHIVQAVTADKKTRQLLLLDKFAPCLKLIRRTWKDKQVVTYVTMIYPGNRYDLAARYSTKDSKLHN